MTTEVKPRLISLDVFRGMTIFLMIIVNTPGAGAVPFSPLLHAEWHGLTLTDLVFPAFLFAVGTAIPFAGSKWNQQSNVLKIGRIFRRTVIIFLIGYFLNWYTSMHWNENGALAFTPFQNLRVLGVLQRIALCYFIAAGLSLYCTSNQMIWISISLLVLYNLLLQFGGQSGDPYSILGNLPRRIDVALIGEKRMYSEHGIVYDPEGILGTLAATVNIVAGILAGRMLRVKRNVTEKANWLFVNGCVALLAGLSWHLIFPLNKKLWTSSFALATIGINLLVLGLLFYLHEIKQFLHGVHFFSVLGKNPLAIYIFSNLLLILFLIPVGDTDLVTWFNLTYLQRVLPGPSGSLVSALLFAMICWLVAWLLDKYKIYIRI